MFPLFKVTFYRFDDFWDGGRLDWQTPSPYSQYPGAEINEMEPCQALGQLSDLAFNWLFTLAQPIRSSLRVDTNLDNDYNS